MEIIKFIALYDRAERYLKEHLGSDTTLKLKAWKVEVATLTNEKDRLYREVRSLRTKVQEAESVRRLANIPRKGVRLMRITLHIGKVTVTIIVKSNNRHSAK